MDKEILKDMGMTGNEVEIYLTLLKSGSISVNTIAEKARLHRQAVYDALERLLEKGFVSYVLNRGKKYFQALHPEKLVGSLQQKEEKLKALLPELISLTHLAQESTFVEVLKGKEVLRSIYRDIINILENESREILISGVQEKTYLNQDPIGLKQHLNRLRKMKCTERILVKEGETMFVEGSQTIYRQVPEQYFSPSPMFVYGNHLTLLIAGDPQHAIIIENTSLAEAYRRQFNLLWKNAKPIRRKKT